MDVFTSLLNFCACGMVIVIAGTVLAKCADTIADLTKLGRLLIGSVLLAGATSLPELIVDITAIRLGIPDLAIGDLLGSSLANLLILALLDLTHHCRGQMLSRRAARHALSGSMSVALAAIVGLSLLTGPMFSHVTLFGVSPGLLLVAAAYIGGIRIVYHDQRVSAGEIDRQEDGGPRVPGLLSKAILRFVAAAGVILVVGPWMAVAAEDFSDATGLSGTFVGTTLVALSTSLPEFVSSLAAIRMGAFDLAVGNVYGSNSFNMLLMVPLDLVHPGSLMGSVAAGHGITCFAVILATQTSIMGQLYNVEGRCRFVDPDAWLVIAIVVVGLFLVYAAQ